MLRTEKTILSYFQVGSCNQTFNKIEMNISTIVLVNAGSEDALKRACSENGPISVAINANIRFQFYNEGMSTCAS